MDNLLIKIQYDGSNYYGWQTQPNGRTVQGEIEKAIKSATGEDVRVIGSGRTDSGVHALGQYCNFKTSTKITPDRIPAALNGNLPKDIRVIECFKVRDNFNARYDAVGKSYIYKIDNNRVYNPILRNYACHIGQELNIQMMEKASLDILGKHDFKGFMSAGSSIKNTIRTVKEINIYKQKNIIQIKISADGFLYNMVRIIVGTLIEIGKGKLPESTMKEMLITGNRNLGGPTAPSHGLYLYDVYYLDIEKSL